MLKTCTKCKISKSIIYFGKHIRAKDGLSWICKECNNAHSRKWASENKDRVKKYRRDNNARLVDMNKWRRYERDYNLTKGMYHTMLEVQGNACKICSDVFSKEPHVDHCHTTGKVRGLLCSRCNTALGLARDSESILMNMIEYLRSVNEI